MAETNALLDGLVRCAAVLQPRGVVVVLQPAQIVAGKAQRRRDASPCTPACPPGRGRVRSVSQYCGMVKALPSGQLRDVIEDAVLIAVTPSSRTCCRPDCGSGTCMPCVDDGLPLERVQIILHGDVDVGEDLQVRLPVEAASRSFCRSARLLFHLADDLALFKVERDI